MVVDGVTLTGWLEPSAITVRLPGSILAELALAETLAWRAAVAPGMIGAAGATSPTVTVWPTISVRVDCTLVPAALFTVSV